MEIYPINTFCYLNGNVIYRKITEGELAWWVCETSNYLLEIVNDKNEKHFELRSEKEKPLYKKDGTLNRFGFKWTDQQVKNNFLIKINNV